jgi:hypothetical protein
MLDVSGQYGTAVGNSTTGRDPGEALADWPELPFHLVVAPSRGRFVPSVTGGEVRVGDVLGYIARENGRRDAVLARVAGHLHGALRFAAQPVGCGAGLYWIGR